VYECAPHKQSGDFPESPHSLNLIFECYLKKGSEPKQPDITDKDQSAVKWISMDDLDAILLFPNSKPHIKNYIKHRRNIEIIEDYKLERYFKNT
jgi:8-oxo-dGTP diphosphatase